MTLKHDSCWLNLHASGWKLSPWRGWILTKGAFGRGLCTVLTVKHTLIQGDREITWCGREGRFKGRENGEIKGMEVRLFW